MSKVYKLSQKKNASSIQVLKTLQVLMQGDYTMNELIEILNEKEPEAVFNNSVISKYINTCRFCEFEIQKFHNRYYVAKIPFGLDLTEIDIDLLKSLQAYIKNEMSSKCADLINSFVATVSRFTNKKMTKIEKEEFKMPIELFERAIYKQRKIKLLFKNQETLECIPLNITEENGRVFYNVFNKKFRSIDSSRLAGVQLSGQRYTDPYGGDQVVVFKLKSPLAKRYEPRANEKIELNADGSIIVTNKNENKEMLFSRLLRYDDKCEILQPKAYREEMKDLINKMLQNYGEN